MALSAQEIIAKVKLMCNKLVKLDALFNSMTPRIQRRLIGEIRRECEDLIDGWELEERK